METLKTNKEFEIVYNNAKKLRDDKIRIFVLKKEDIDRSKVAYVVSKRFGNAVSRNRIKRLMREAWRYVDVPETGYMFILLPQQTTINCKPKEIESSIRRLLEKERVLNNT